MSEPQADTVELADGGEPLETLLERDPIELAGDKDKPDAAARGRELLGIYPATSPRFRSSRRTRNSSSPGACKKVMPTPSAASPKPTFASWCGWLVAT